jgi:cytoskeletal protein CcmA (bactofilin family)
MDLHRRYYPETRLPASLAVSADLQSSEDIAVEGSFDGEITVPDHHVEIGLSANVRGRIVARTVTIYGTLDGSIVAGERVDIERTATFRGHVTTPSLALFEGARFNGTVDPARTEAAMRVAAYRQKQKGA